MKTIKYILYAFIATFVLASCSDDIKYTPGEGDDPNSYGVYFLSQKHAGDNELDPAEPTTLSFTAMRKNYKDAITVPVEVSSNVDGIFAVSDVKFEAGQKETTFTVDFPNAEIGKTYDCSIVVKDKKYALLYGEYSCGIDFSVTRVQWNLVKGPNGETTGMWRDEFFTAMMGSNIKENGVPNAEKAVEIYERADKPGYYRIKDIYDEAYMMKIVGTKYSNVPSVPTYTIIDAQDPEKVWFPVQPTGWEINGVGYDDNGAFVIVSFCQENYPNEASATMYGTLEDGVLTFPPKAILLSLPSIWEATSYYKANTEMTRLIFPGAKSYDYSVAFAKSAPADGKVDITATLGSDVAKVKYAYFEGALSASLVAAKSGDIDAGTVPSEEISASGTLTAVMEKTGIYTIVGNTYDDKGNLQKYGYVTFGYVKAGEEKPVVMSVRTELTWEKEKEGHTPENSIKGILFGEEIEAGYIGLFTTASVQGMSEAQLIAGVKASGKALTAEQIAKINTTGYAPFYIGLSKGTSYTLLVYADNGYNTELFTVEQTTEGAPDPYQVHYMPDDILGGYTKDGYLKTWNYYAVDVYDKTNTSRQFLGQVVISENTTDDTQAMDYVNISGISTLASDLAEKDDTFPAVWQNGFLYPTSQRYIGKYSSYFIQNLYSCEESTSLYSGLGLFIGGRVADGFVAFVPNPDDLNNPNEPLTFAGMYFGAFSGYDPATGAFTGHAGGLAHVKWLLLVDPAVDTKTNTSAVTRAVSVHPNNFVELRGSELIRALQLEANGKPANRGADPLEGEVSVRVVTPTMSSFSEGFAPRANSLQSGVMEKMPLKKMAE